MTAHVRRPAGTTATTDVNRVVTYLTADSVPSSPDTLTLLKRRVQEYDLLEKADPLTWAGEVALLEAKYQPLFLTHGADRARRRHRMYGLQRSHLLQLYEQLVLFSPADVTEIGAWYENSTTGAIASVTDNINVNPATQPTGLRQPTGDASMNMSFVDDCLLISPIAANNQLVTWGYAGWLELDNLTVQHMLFRSGPGALNDPAATDSHLIRVSSAEALVFRAYNDATGTLAREGTTAVSALSGSPKFITVEINLGAIGDAAKVTITIDGAVMSLTFADAVGAPGAMPSALQGAPSAMMLGNRRSNLSTLPLIGRIGRSFYILRAKMPAATEGLLTAAMRTRLRNFQPMV